MGLRLGDVNIALDTRDREANVNFVSHAHSDHIAGVCKGKALLSSSITRELIEVRTKRGLGDPVELENTRLLDAGHILGSKQLYAEADGFCFTYSGDYQMRRSDVAAPIQTRGTDVLVIDSTYPHRGVVFDDREEVAENIRAYLNSKLEKGVVIFGAYTLGKAQELIKIANKEGIAPVVGSKISALNEVYKRHKVRLDYVKADGEEATFADAMPGNFFGIIPMHEMGDAGARLARAYGKRVFTGVATGFAKVFDMGTDVQFCLSDHADFKQAVEYINECSPRLIYTYGRRHESEVFARNLTQDGYNAHPFKAKEMEIMACAIGRN